MKCLHCEQAVMFGPFGAREAEPEKRRSQRPADATTSRGVVSKQTAGNFNDQTVPGIERGEATPVAPTHHAFSGKEREGREAVGPMALTTVINIDIY